MKGLMDIFKPKKEEKGQTASHNLTVLNLGFKTRKDLRTVHNNCLALTTDKPVYKKGETIKAVLFLYDKFSKKPLKKEKRTINPPRLKVLDGNDKLIKTFSPAEQVLTNHCFSFEIPVEKEWAGGFYKLSVDGSTEFVKFFVLDFVNAGNAIVADWNKDTLYENDSLLAKVSLRSMANEDLRSVQIPLRVTFTGSNGQVLKTENKLITNNETFISFTTPGDLRGIQAITCSLEAQLGSETLRSSKQFSVANLSEIVVNFHPEGGRYVLDHPNLIYFEAFADKNEGNGLQVQSGVIIEQTENGVEREVAVATSEPSGRGSVEITPFRGANYFLLIQMGEAKRRFPVLGGKQISPTLMKVKEKVLSWEGVLETSLVNPEKSMSLRVVDKTLILFSAPIQTDLKVPLSELKLKNGGVLTVQLLNSKEETIQESLIFVQPKQKLKFEVKTKFDAYSPKDTVDIQVNSSEDCFANVIVTDESAFLEIEKRRLPPSLFTKVFLEKELKFKSKDFPDSSTFIDSVFDSNSPDPKVSNPRSLELLLGVQSWRTFFLTEEGLKKSASNSSQPNTSELENIIPLSCKEMCEKLNPPVELLRNRPMMRGLGRAPMVKCAVRNVDRRLNANFDLQEAPDFMKKELECKSVKKSKAKTSPPRQKNQKFETNSVEDESFQNDSVLNDPDLIKPQESDILIHDNVLFTKFLPVSGSSNFSFSLPSHVSTFRVSVIGFTSKGNYGFVDSQLVSQKPFSAKANYPVFIRKGEVLNQQVVFRNNHPSPLNFSVQTIPQTLSIAPRDKTVATLSLPSESLPVQIHSQSQFDEIEPIIIGSKVIGYTPFETSVTGPIQSGQKVQKLLAKISLPVSFVSNTLSCKIRNVSLSPSLAISGIESLIKTPYGCFEQTSCTTFPMVLAGQYLRNQPDSESKTKLMMSLDKELKAGIKRLLGFECKNGGFEWFGSDPGHVTLTAYGIWQFNEMRALNPDYIDKAVIDRSLAWLQKQSEAPGKFKLRSGLDSLGRPPQMLSDAFICFVLSDFMKANINFKHPVMSKIEEYEKNPNDFNDAYHLALIGLIYSKVEQPHRAQEIAGKLVSMQTHEGSIAYSKTSITNSIGKSLLVETTALSLLLFLQTSTSPDVIEKAVEFLISRNNKGQFESTQGTVLALKALLEYTSKSSHVPESTKLSVKINSQKVGELFIPKPSKENSDPCTELDISPNLQPLQPGQEATVEVEPSDPSEFKVNVEIEHSYEVTDPVSTPESPLSLQVQKLDNGDQITYNSLITNKEQKEQGMTIVVMEIDSRCKPNINDLEVLRLGQIVDNYELKRNGSQLVLYYKGLKAGDSRKASISMTKAYQVENPAKTFHSAWLYYGKSESLIYTHHT